MLLVLNIPPGEECSKSYCLVLRLTKCSETLFLPSWRYNFNRTTGFLLYVAGIEEPGGFAGSPGEQLPAVAVLPAGESLFLPGLRCRHPSPVQENGADSVLHLASLCPRAHLELHRWNRFLRTLR